MPPKNAEFETRINIDSVEIRTPDIALGADAESVGTLVGHAAVFNKASARLGFFVETIRPGAFARSLKENPDVRALIDHDSGRVIGRTKSGTLRLNEDDSGLKVEIDLPDNTQGRDLAESVNRGDIDGMSFGFNVREDSWNYTDDKDEPDERTLIDIDLFEVSAVTFPAYPDTDLAKRSWEKSKPEKNTFNRKLLQRERGKILKIKSKQY
tara:strand:+ start:695 stop:1324 length:630 start_codon:yes stop_codon:yes gene_type:complete